VQYLFPETKKGVMETFDFYVDQSDPSQAAPFRSNDDFTPFGTFLQTTQQNYTNYQPSISDPSVFTINGLDTCKKSSNCGQQLYQSFRLSSGNKEAYKMYSATYQKALKENGMKFHVAEEL
jgi:hypothetical protein